MKTMGFAVKFLGTCGLSVVERCPALSRSPLKCKDIVQKFNTLTRLDSRSVGLGAGKTVKRKALLVSLSLASPLKIFRRNDVDQTSEILKNIPKEVFKKDDFKRPKRSSLVRLFFRFIYQIKLGIRFIKLTCIYWPIVTLYPLACMNRTTKIAWWKLLLFAFEHTGPTFIKLGQWASTRRDLFDEEFCSIFSKLYSQTQHHSWYWTKQKLQKAFGKNWKKIFVRIDRKPAGSGCIAQVHKGYMYTRMVPDESIVEEMSEDDQSEDIDFAEGIEISGFSRAIDAVDRDGGNYQSSQTGSHQGADGCEIAVTDEEEFIPVAIKVLHPGIYRSVSRDLKIMRVMASFVELVFPSLRWLSIQESLSEFSEIMTKQIDLRYESECLDRFVENFESVPNVRFPRPVRPFCKRDVLVETWEEGIPIQKFIREKDVASNLGDLKEALASIGIDAILKMVFIDNFVHGDLHPGNIFVQNAEYFNQTDENKVMLVDVGDTTIVSMKPIENPLRLVLLDTGISPTLSAKDRENFRSVFSAVVLGEGEQVAELMLKHSTHNECKDVEGFKTELGALVNTFRQSAISLSKVEVGSLLTQVFSILAKHKVKMESNFASVVLAIFVLEGLGRSLDPNVDLLERAKPVVLKGTIA